MVELLLQHGANPNAFTIPSHASPYFLTPLQAAIITEIPTRYDIVKTLIKYGADVNLHKGKDILQGPPLIIAIAQKDYDMVKLLLDSGADINAFIITEDGCQIKPLGEAAYVGDIKIAELLIQYGARVNESSEQLSTPYHLAAYKGYLDFLKFLFEIYPAPNIIGCHRMTPLFSAVQSESENFDVVKFLVEAGAYVNAIDDQGDSPLYYALKQKKSRVISYLVEHGAKFIFNGEVVMF